MRARIVLICPKGHRWDQQVEVEHTGIEGLSICPQHGRLTRAKLVNMPDAIQHCPDCGRRYESGDGTIQ